MTLETTIITSLLSSGALIYLARAWISERLKNAIKSEYDLKLEEYKRRLELDFNDQVKRRHLYDELTNAVEEFFGSGQGKTREDLSLAMNKLFGKLALYAPDEVYLSLKDALIDKGIVYGKDVKPKIYHAIRKSLFGQETKLVVGDFVPHIDATPVPETPSRTGGTPPNNVIKLTGSSWPLFSAKGNRGVVPFGIVGYPQRRLSQL